MRRTACLLFAVVGAALCLLDASSARADVYDDNPATASRGPGELYVFARAATGEVLERHRVNANWSDWASIGGEATSGPSAVAYGQALLVFVRGPDGGIYQNTLEFGRWTGWFGIGGYSTSAPSAAVRRASNNLIDLTVKGSDNAIWHRAYVPNSGWTTPATIGGGLTTAPVSISQSDTQLNIFSRGTDGAMYQRGWTGSAWSDWINLGGGLIGAPTAVSRAKDVLDIYVRGGGDILYQKYWTPAGWSDWFLVDGTAAMDSSPAAGADGPGHEWVVARNRGSIMLKEWNAGTGWGAWQDFGPVAVQVPVPPPESPPASAPLPVGQVSLKTGIACTPAAGRLRVSVAVKKPKGKSKPRVTKIVFFTKGKGRRIRTDRKAPFEVHLQINRPAGSTGRVYARVYYKRTAHGKTFRKVVSRRYKVCR